MKDDIVSHDNKFQSEDVIPREGVESIQENPTPDAYFTLSVIPREGVESLQGLADPRPHPRSK